MEDLPGSQQLSQAPAGYSALASQVPLWLGCFPDRHSTHHNKKNGNKNTVTGINIDIHINIKIIIIIIIIITTTKKNCVCGCESTLDLVLQCFTYIVWCSTMDIKSSFSWMTVWSTYEDHAVCYQQQWNPVHSIGSRLKKKKTTMS